MLAFEGAQILDVVGPMQMLAAVNDENPAAAPVYSLRLLAERKGPFATSGGVSLVADASYAALPKSIHTLMVAGGSIERALRDRKLAAAVRAGAARAERVVSICTGLACRG